MHLGPLDQQRQVALAAQQRLEPVDEAQAASIVQRPSAHAPARRAAISRARRGLALVAQRLASAAARTSGRTRSASSSGSCSRKASLSSGGGGPPQLRQPPLPSAGAVGSRPSCSSASNSMRHELAHLAQPVEQLAGVGGARQAQAARDPVQVAVGGGQQVGLLVVEVLDAVLDAAQEGVGLGQPPRAVGLHQAAGGELVQRLQRRARADLGELAAAHDQQQLHDELDLADAAARELDVVGALGPAGGAALRLVAHLAVQLAQALEHAVVEVAAVDEGRDDRSAAPRARPLSHAGARRDDAALQPGEALPLAALHLQVFLQHRQAHRRRARSCRSGRSARSTRKTKPSSVVSPISAYRPRATCAKYSCALIALRPGGLAVFLVDVDQVDVGRDVELARAELAHADDPELDAARRPRVRGAPWRTSWSATACASASSSVASASSRHGAA